jgi:hypothetical protein
MTKRKKRNDFVTTTVPGELIRWIFFLFTKITNFVEDVARRSDENGMWCNCPV